jgi:hypothetical protein
MILLAAALLTQQAAKVDSLRLVLGTPFDQAYSRVASAMTEHGLTITNSTPIMIEADEGATQDLLIGGTRHRIARAILLRRGSDSTVVQIVGREVVSSRSNHDEMRIDNRAKGNGGRVWRKMVAVAWALDSTQVPREVIPIGDDGVLAVGADRLPADTGYAFAGSMKRREYYPLACKKKIDAIVSADVVWIANADQGKAMGFTPGDITGC